MQSQQSVSAAPAAPSKTRPRLRWALLAAILLAAYGGVHTYISSPPPLYKNNYLQGDIGGSFFKWQWERLTQGLPKPPANGYHFPIVQSDARWLQANKEVSTATWIGHATVLVQMRGVNILTDPIWSERASPFNFMGPQRKVPPALSYAQLPHIDVVIILSLIHI